jgi:RHS repeat-associated protein
MQGAGGVGGLIEATYYGTATTSCFAAFDGNGNVSALINAADGTTAAQYEYGPFGEVIRATGPMAKLNPFRFSTKYCDDETDLVYYGYRYYNPSTGRWPSRDPMEERGGLNLYEFVLNSPVNYVDLLGLLTRSAIERTAQDMDNAIKNISCCCSGIREVFLTLQGSASGSSVTLSAKITPKGNVSSTCPVSVVKIYWWDCVTAQGVFLPNPIKDFHDYGWYEGGTIAGGDHVGGTHVIGGIDWGDSMHWDWTYYVIYITCGKDQHEHAYLKQGPDEEFTWSTKTASWIPEK